MRAGTPCSPLGARRAVFLASPTTEDSYSVADRAYHREGIKMKSGMRNIALGASVVAVLTMLTACSGGDFGPPPPPTYTVGGTVTGLSGSGLILVNSASGALTAVPGSPFPAGTDPKALALLGTAPWGTYLYVANAGSDTVSAYAVDSSSGALTPLSPATFATGKGPSSIAVDPSLGYIYVANNGGSNDVSAFSVDIGTGLLTPLAGSPFPAGANPLSLALGPKAVGTDEIQFLYTANPDATNPSISGFNLIGAVPTPLSGSPFPLVVGPYIATDRTSAYLYVTAGSGIVGYGIDGTIGMLTPLPGFPVVTGTAPHLVTFDTTNQFLYVANDGSADVSGFGFDASTGGLTPITGSPFPAGNLPDFLATL